MKPFRKNMFEGELAEFYDLMRQYRNYDLECSFADEIIHSRCPNAKDVLDIFCGTGEHAFRMAQRGYAMTGVDASQDMIAVAQAKNDTARVSVSYQCSDITDLEAAGQYDAAYCLGYTFLYMLSHTDVRSFFEIVHNALVPGGVFLVDFINGWSLMGGSGGDKRFHQSEGVRILQLEQLEVRKQERLLHIDYCYLIDRDDGHVKTVFSEEDLRIFFDDEVQSLLSASGFRNVKSYGDYSVTDSESTDPPNIIIEVGQKA